MRALVLSFIAAIASVANADTLNLDPGRTKVDFTLGDVLHTVHGSFRLAHGNIQFDSQTRKCSGEIAIDARSGDSGSEARDSRMKKSILEADRFPEIVFLPDRFQGSVPAEGAGHADVHGVFRIHGADHELTVPVDIQRSNGQLEFKTRFDVPYVQWGMKNPSTLILRVDKTVRIDIDAVAQVAR
jgi:polyisoprenoid-binding protein YceI